MTTLGAITSHCYLVSGVFPDRIAFPCLAAALLGPSAILSDQLLQNYFLCCLSAHEAAMVREGIQFSGSKFEPSLQAELTSILGLYGCLGTPQPSTLKQLIVQASRYTFLVKPAAPIARMHSGIPKEHQTVRRFHTIYSSLSVSASKVLELLREPVIHNEGQECAWSYLRRFVGNMTIEELRSFLRSALSSVLTAFLVIFFCCAGYSCNLLFAPRIRGRIPGSHFRPNVRLDDELCVARSERATYTSPASSVIFPSTCSLGIFAPVLINQSFFLGSLR